MACEITVLIDKSVPMRSRLYQNFGVNPKLEAKSLWKPASICFIFLFCFVFLPVLPFKEFQCCEISTNVDFT